MIRATIKIQFPKEKIIHRFIAWFRRSAYKINLPESWDEVPKRKRKKVLYALMQQGTLDDSTVKVLLLKALLPIPSWAFFLLQPLEIFEKLEPCVVWFLATPMATPFDVIVRGGWFRWRLPDPAAKNMSLGQYLKIEQEWMAMARGDNDIMALLATILRPDTKATTKALNKVGLLPTATDPVRRAWANKLEKLPAEYIYYVVDYWRVQREQLEKDYPNFFSKGEGKPKSINWDSIPARIAETGVFGPVNEVLKTPARIYLAWANDKQEQEGVKNQESLQEIIRANHNKFIA